MVQYTKAPIQGSALLEKYAHKATKDTQVLDVAPVKTPPRWLHDQQKEKPRYLFYGGVLFTDLVPET
jgi:hypothetical protein